MTTATKYTAPPFIARQDFVNRWRIEKHVPGCVPVSIAIVTTTTLGVGAVDYEEIAANAEFICRAMNNHDELVAACKLALRDLIGLGAEDFDAHESSTCDALRTIIAKSELDERLSVAQKAAWEAMGRQLCPACGQKMVPCPKGPTADEPGFVGFYPCICGDPGNLTTPRPIAKG